MGFKLLGSETVKGMEAEEMWTVFLRKQLICCYDHYLEAIGLSFFSLHTFWLHVNSDSSLCELLDSVDVRCKKWAELVGREVQFLPFLQSSHFHSGFCKCFCNSRVVSSNVLFCLGTVRVGFASGQTCVFHQGASLVRDNFSVCSDGVFCILSNTS